MKHAFSKPLCDIFNLSFTTGIYPDKLKLSETIPVFKKGSKLEVSNYRPISLLSNINKILEKLMYIRVYNFLEQHKCIYEQQFGFREKHSTTHALINITETIREAIDNNKIVCGVFVDLKKAFDTVNHPILLKKLQYYGIRGNANDWFQSYLDNRQQFVSINGFKSDTKSLRHGVPQGSVLGPLLFLIYINDLNLAIENSKVYHFADDTNLLHINDSPKQTEKCLNRDLKSIHNWLLANKISLNDSKTEIIFFHKPNAPVPDVKIKINGTRLRHTSAIKYLGIYLDENLNGVYHSNILLKKLYTANRMLAKARHYTPDNILTLYHAIFSSHIRYGHQIWGLANNKTIYNLQKKALRIVSFSNFRAHSSPIFREKRILKLEDQIELDNCLFVHDFLNNKLPKCFDNYFTPLNMLSNLTTRNSTAGCLFIPHVNSVRYGRNSIKVKSITTWNFFVRVFKDIKLKDLSRNDLKSKITNFMLNCY